jgi:hypothetical protein
MGMNADNTVLAESSCPDEVNHNDYMEDISNRLNFELGEVFYLGGLAGVPFAGRGGWNTLASHVPQEGNIFVLFAPHVGVSENGELGKVLRPGQN